MMYQKYIRFLFLFYCFNGICFKSFASESNEIRNNIVEQSADLIAKKWVKYREDQSKWNRLLRGFRRDHNFSTTFGKSVSSWSYLTKSSDAESHQQVDSNFYDIACNYSFYLPLDTGYGYYLGSSIRINSIENSVNGKNIVFRGFILPGFLAGLSWNVTPAFRLDLTFGAHLLRLEQFNTESRSSQRPKFFDFTMREISTALSVDFFYSLEWGFRFEALVSNSQYIPIKDAQDNNLLGSSLLRSQNRFSSGVVFHLI